MQRNTMQRAKAGDPREQGIHLVYSRDWTHENTPKMQSLEGQSLRTDAERHELVRPEVAAEALLARIIRARRTLSRWMRILRCCKAL
jgi:hypothetical protein